LDIIFTAESKMKYTYYTCSRYTSRYTHHISGTRYNLTCGTGKVAGHSKHGISQNAKKTSSQCNYLLSEL